MASSLPGLSASVTRILSLTGFPKELKTKDIQSAFAEWENANGGFKIKWRDDTSLLIVFQDASVGKSHHISCFHRSNSPLYQSSTMIAKRAYLQAIAFPPAILTSFSTGQSAIIKPYDGPDAQSVIHTVNSRGQHHSNPSRSTHAPRAASISVMPAHGRAVSAVLHNGPNGHPLRTSTSNNTGSVPYNLSEREPSPTLPSLPTHPTLNSLISSSLGEVVARDAAGAPPADPAILATSLHPESLIGGGPRIGDPGKRMLGNALGLRHPALGPRVLNGVSGGPSQEGSVDHGLGEVQRAMSGLAVAE
jgi:hypothetical protein